MTDLRKAAEMALEVLKQSLGYSNEAQARIGEAKQALRQALAQPVEAHYKPRYNPTINAFDTAPPCQTGAQCIGGKCPECEREWVGLDKSDMNVLRSVAEFTSDAEGFIRLVEEKLKGKNT